MFGNYVTNLTRIVWDKMWEAGWDEELKISKNTLRYFGTLPKLKKPKYVLIFTIFTFIIVKFKSINSLATLRSKSKLLLFIVDRDLPRRSWSFFTWWGSEAVKINKKFSYITQTNLLTNLNFDFFKNEKVSAACQKKHPNRHLLPAHVAQSPAANQTCRDLQWLSGMKSFPHKIHLKVLVKAIKSGNWRQFTTLIASWDSNSPARRRKIPFPVAPTSVDKLRTRRGRACFDPWRQKLSPSTLSRTSMRVNFSTARLPVDNQKALAFCCEECRCALACGFDFPARTSKQASFWVAICLSYNERDLVSVEFSFQTSSGGQKKSRD